MPKPKKVSTLIGLIIIVAAVVVLFGGVFAYQYSATWMPRTQGVDSNKSYLGKWIDSNTTNVYQEVFLRGGNILNIEEISSNYIKGHLYSIQLPPANRIADFEFEGPLINGKLNFNYEDSFFTKGSGTLLLEGDKIDVSLKSNGISADNSSGWEASGGIFIRPIE